MLGHHLVESPVFPFQLPRPSRLADLQASVLRLAAVVYLLADPVLAAQFAHPDPSFVFLQHLDDLLPREAALPLREFPSGLLYPGKLTLPRFCAQSDAMCTRSGGRLVAFCLAIRCLAEEVTKKCHALLLFTRPAFCKKPFCL